MQLLIGMRYCIIISPLSASLILQLILAKVYYSSNRKDQAKATYNEILAKDDQKVEALKGLAELSFEANDYKQAEVFYLQILSLHTKNDWALAQIGRVELLRGDLEGAKTRLLEAIQINSNIALYFYWLGLVYWKLGGKIQEYWKIVLIY
jgi:tetratricopeptide (TPR) repeat protein